jgi:hypothetical protein
MDCRCSVRNTLACRVFRSCWLGIIYTIQCVKCILAATVASSPSSSSCTVTPSSFWFLRAFLPVPPHHMCPLHVVRSEVLYILDANSHATASDGVACPRCIYRHTTSYCFSIGANLERPGILFRISASCWLVYLQESIPHTRFTCDTCGMLYLLVLLYAHRLSAAHFFLCVGGFSCAYSLQSESC